MPLKIDPANLLTCSVGYIIVLPRVGSHGPRFVISYEQQHPLWMDHMLLKHILLVLYPAICNKLNLGSFYLETFYATHAPFWVFFSQLDVAQSNFHESCLWPKYYLSADLAELKVSNKGYQSTTSHLTP